jgi:hypothetical protein
VTLAPNSRFLLVDLDAALTTSTPTMIATACRVRKERASAGKFSFLDDGIADTNAVVRIRTQRNPTRVLVAGKPLSREDYDRNRDTLRIRFPNSAESVPVEVDFTR